MLSLVNPFLVSPLTENGSLFSPPHGNLKPDIAIYVAKSRPSFQIQSRTDLFNHPSIIALKVISGHETFLLINIYNPSDCSSLGPIINTDLSSFPKTFITRDFNFHHPLWSKPSHNFKFSENSEFLVDSLSDKNFVPLNKLGAITFFWKDYTSVLDLSWSSLNATAHVTDFKVNYAMFTGSNHYPISWSILASPLDPTPPTIIQVSKSKEEDWSSCRHSYRHYDCHFHQNPLLC